MTWTRASPHDLGAERILLGSCVLSVDAIDTAIGLVDPGDFHVPLHASAFAAVIDLRASGDHVDPFTLAAKVEGLEAATVTDWEALVSSSGAISTHAARVADLSARRSLARIAADLDTAARNGATIETAVTAARERLEAVGAGSGQAVRLVTLDSIDPERVGWLWAGRLPMGKVSVFDGDPGAGKSTVAVDLASRVTTGSPMPDGDRSIGAPRDVIYLTAEDGIADTLRPRLDAADGDPARFHVLDAVASTDDDGRMTWRPPRIPADCALLERIITDTAAVLVVVDVLAAYLDVRDGHADGDVRRALHPLARVADRTGAAVVVIRHLRKSRGSAIYAGGGSIGVIGAARAGLLAAADPADETGTRRVLAVSKSNLAAMPSALAYEVVPAEEHGCARIRWTGLTHHRADDLLAIVDTADAEEGADARSVLAELLADGPVPVKEVVDLMASAGFSKDQAKRAKARLHARSVKVGRPGDPGSGWEWELPRTEHEGSEGSGHTDPAPFTPFVLSSDQPTNADMGAS